MRFLATTALVLIQIYPLLASSQRADMTEAAIFVSCLFLRVDCFCFLSFSQSGNGVAFLKSNFVLF